jgi:hypothetical protein
MRTGAPRAKSLTLWCQRSTWNIERKRQAVDSLLAQAYPIRKR